MKKTSKLLSVFLVVAMMLSLSVPAFAVSEDNFVVPTTDTVANVYVKDMTATDNGDGTYSADIEFVVCTTADTTQVTGWSGIACSIGLPNTQWCSDELNKPANYSIPTTISPKCYIADNKTALTAVDSDPFTIGDMTESSMLYRRVTNSNHKQPSTDGVMSMWTLSLKNFTKADVGCADTDLSFDVGMLGFFRGYNSLTLRDKDGQNKDFPDTSTINFTGGTISFPAPAAVTHSLSYAITGEEPDAATVTGDVPAVAQVAEGAAVVNPTLTSSSTTNAAGKTGTWTFNGWTAAPALAAGDTMPASDVVMTGTWTFNEAATYTVTYNVNGGDAGTGPAPETGILAGTHTLDTATTPTKAATDRATYRFAGWASSAASTTPIADVTITNANVEVFAIWTEVLKTYDLTYTFGTDVSKYPSAWDPSVTLNAGIATVVDGAVLQPALTSSSTANRAGEKGSWTFDGWTPSVALGTGDTMPASNVTMTGAWTFTEDDKYGVTYKWDGADGVPSDKTLPADTKTYYAGDPVTIDTTFDATSTSTAMKGALKGSWTFSGWTPPPPTANMTAPIAPATTMEIAGEWTFTEAAKYGVVYDWSGGTDGVPTGQTLPINANTYYAGDTYPVDATFTAGQSIVGTKGTLNGTWTFSGWDKSGSQAMVAPATGTSVTITGTWRFTEAGKYSVTYNWTDAPAGEVLPIDNTTYYEGKNYTVDAGYTNATSVAGTNAAGKAGNWVFSGWKLGSDVKTGQQTMGAANVVLTGAWSFVPGEATVTFKVVNGTWDGTDTAGKTVNVTLTGGKGTLLASDVPTGMQPNPNYTGGAWNTAPNTAADGITGDVTYTYTFAPAGGGGGYVPSDPSYTLTFEVNGGNAVASVTRTSGTVVDLTAYTTARSGFTFEGWYSDSALTTKVASVTLNSNKTVYAKWSATSRPDMFRTDHVAYIVGYEDGNVHPTANITRAEVATIFFRLLDDSTRSANLTTRNNFNDVTGMWYNTAVSTLAAMGIVDGREDGSFGGSVPITRAEFAAIAARFAATTYTGADKFNDISGHWANELINRAANLGWIEGYSDGSFKPNQAITRAEAMTLANRVLNRLPETTSDLLAGMKTWGDNADTAAWYYLAVQEATNSHDNTVKADGVHETWKSFIATPDWESYEK